MIIDLEKELKLLGESSDEVNDATRECFNIITEKLGHILEMKGVLWRLNRLVSGLPLSPLTGEEDEWLHTGEEERDVYQNVRCGSVFKTVKEGKVEYKRIGAIRFTGEYGATYTSRYSSEKILSFPYEVPDTTKVLNFEESEKYQKSCEDL
jgi:hypothetical protein